MTKRPVIAPQPTPPTDSKIRARYPANAAFSEGQMERLRYLDALKPEEKCHCGWYKRGECPNHPEVAPQPTPEPRIACPTCLGDGKVSAEFAKREWKEKFEAAPQGVGKLSPEPQWISVSERMPEPETPVLVLYGKLRTVAEWVPKFYKSDDGAYEGDCDYDEAKDEYFWPEGFYEFHAEGEETCWLLYSDKLTHWMPLPKPIAMTDSLHYIGVGQVMTGEQLMEMATKRLKEIESGESKPAVQGQLSVEPNGVEGVGQTARRKLNLVEPPKFEERNGYVYVSYLGHSPQILTAVEWYLWQRMTEAELETLTLRAELQQAREELLAKKREND